MIMDEKQEKTKKKGFPTMYRKKSKKSEYIISIIFSLICLYIVNNLLAWHVPFLKESWTAPLWILNVSLVFSILTSFILLFYDRNWLKGSLRIIANVISLAFLITFYVVFPLDISEGWTLLVRILLIIALIGTAIATFFEFGRIFTRD